MSDLTVPKEIQETADREPFLWEQCPDCGYRGGKTFRELGGKEVDKEARLEHYFSPEHGEVYVECYRCHIRQINEARERGELEKFLFMRHRVPYKDVETYFKIFRVNPLMRNWLKDKYSYGRDGPDYHPVPEPPRHPKAVEQLKEKGYL